MSMEGKICVVRGGRGTGATEVFSFRRYLNLNALPLPTHVSVRNYNREQRARQFTALALVKRSPKRIKYSTPRFTKVFPFYSYIIFSLSVIFRTTLQPSFNCVYIPAPLMVEGILYTSIGHKRNLYIGTELLKCNVMVTSQKDGLIYVKVDFKFMYHQATMLWEIAGF